MGGNKGVWWGMGLLLVLVMGLNGLMFNHIESQKKSTDSQMEILRATISAHVQGGTHAISSVNTAKLAAMQSDIQDMKIDIREIHNLLIRDKHAQ